MFNFSVSGFSWWLNLGKFIIAIFFSFFIPGSLFLNSKKFPAKIIFLTLSELLGMTLFAWQEFIFGYLKQRNFTYFYLLICSIFWFKKYFRDIIPTKKWAKINVVLILKNLDFLAILIVLLGVFVQVMPLWKNGIWTKQGFLFFGGNTSDNLWYVTLTKELVNRFPPLEPGLPGIELKNYHYWASLLIAGIVRIFGLPLFTTQFQFFSLLISFLLALSLISFSQIIFLKRNALLWLLFFGFFGGDFFYLILLILNRNQDIFALSSLEDGAKFLYNPTRAFSFVIALGGLSFFALWQRRKKEFYLGLLSMFLLASTIGFKVNIALFFFPGILTLLIFQLFKKNIKEALILVSFFLFFFLVYFPTNAQAGGLIWAPFTLVNEFIVQPSLNLGRWELARRIFLADNKYLKNLVFEFSFTAIFVVGILGTKIISFSKIRFFLLEDLADNFFSYYSRELYLPSFWEFFSFKRLAEITYLIF